MRILYLHQYFATGESSAGTRSYEFARRLVRDGHEVIVVTSPAALPQALRDEAETTGSVALEGIQLRVVPVGYSNQMANEERIKSFLVFAGKAAKLAVRERPDLVFATSTPLTIAIPALITQVTKQIPMVFEVRDLWPDVPIAMGALQNPLMRAAARALERTAYRRSIRVIALSEGMKAGITRTGYPAEQVRVITNVSNTALFDVPESAGDHFRKEFECTEPGRQLVVYAGAFGRVNGVGYLVKLAASLKERAPEIRFALVGTGVELPDVERQARELGVLDRNLFLRPPVPKTEVPALLAAATLTTSTVIPVRELWQHSANKFFDSFAAGKPIAINHEGWQADLLRETGAGPVLSHDDLELAARQLLEFLRDPVRLQHSREAAKALATTRYDLEALYAEFQQVLIEARAAFTNRGGR